MKKLFTDKDTRICAYIFPNGIMFRFSRTVSVGKTDTVIQCCGLVRKKVTIRTYGNQLDSNGNPLPHYPYLVSDVNSTYGLMEKALLAISIVEHWLSNDSEISKAQGYRNECVFLHVDKVGRIESRLIHGLPGYDNYPLHVGVCRPLNWNNDLDTAYAMESASSAVVFDVTVEDKE